MILSFVTQAHRNDICSLNSMRDALSVSIDSFRFNVSNHRCKANFLMSILSSAIATSSRIDVPGIRPKGNRLYQSIALFHILSNIGADKNSCLSSLILFALKPSLLPLSSSSFVSIAKGRTYPRSLPYISQREYALFVIISGSK